MYMTNMMSRSLGSNPAPYPAFLASPLPSNASLPGLASTSNSNNELVLRRRSGQTGLSASGIPQARLHERPQPSPAAYPTNARMPPPQPPSQQQQQQHPQQPQQPWYSQGHGPPPNVVRREISLSELFLSSPFTDHAVILPSSRRLY